MFELQQGSACPGSQTQRRLVRLSPSAAPPPGIYAAVDCAILRTFERRGFFPCYAIYYNLLLFCCQCIFFNSNTRIILCTLLNFVFIHCASCAFLLKKKAEYPWFAPDIPPFSSVFKTLRLRCLPELRTLTGWTPAGRPGIPAGPPLLWAPPPILPSGAGRRPCPALWR